MGSPIQEQALYRLLFDETYELEPEDDPDDPDYTGPDDEVNEEHEDDEFDPDEETDESPTYTGRDGTMWSRNPITRSGRSAKFAQRIYVPGPAKAGKDASTPLDFWRLLIDAEIMNEIVQQTNDEIRLKKEKRQKSGASEQSYHGPTTEKEILALFGLMYIAGIQKSSKLNTEDIWSTDNGINVFRATMSEHRFRYLLTCIRFDDKVTREDRALNDNFTPMRYVWSRFIKNCTNNYSPSQNLTVDEQLLGFRGHTRGFKVYIKQKPAKFGIKIFMLNDTSTSYMFNAIPYTGKSPNERSEEERKKNGGEGKKKPPSKRKSADDKEKGKREIQEKKRLENLEKDYAASKYVRELCLPIQNTNRNVTVDNWFSSVPLFNEMLIDYKISMVGTVRKALPQVPNFFKQKQEPGTTLFAFDETKVLTSYTSTTKNPKVVLLMSTLNNTYNKDINVETGKPNIIHFYNNTKGGTDTFDLLCSNYTTTRRTNRWTVRFWCGMLDMAGINSQILYSLKTKEDKLVRRKYLMILAQSMIEGYLRGKYENKNIAFYIRSTIKRILKIDDQQPTSSDLSSPATPAEKGVKCYICLEESQGKLRRNKVGNCDICGKPICKTHEVTRCIKCARQQVTKSKTPKKTTSGLFSWLSRFR
jgi:hypothetical protein